MVGKKVVFCSYFVDVVEEESSRSLILEEAAESESQPQWVIVEKNLTEGSNKENAKEVEAEAEAEVENDNDGLNTGFSEPKGGDPEGGEPQSEPQSEPQGEHHQTLQDAQPLFEEDYGPPFTPKHYSTPKIVHREPLRSLDASPVLPPRQEDPIQCKKVEPGAPKKQLKRKCLFPYSNDSPIKQQQQAGDAKVEEDNPWIKIQFKSKQKMTLTLTLHPLGEISQC